MLYFSLVMPFLHNIFYLCSMIISITEVQVTCIILMGLITLFLAFVLPTYTVAGRHYHHARKILSGSTFLVMLHFIAQYMLHKEADNIIETRTIINLLFGVPISYLANMSYIYLQREGKVPLHHWLYAPFILLIECAILAITWSVSRTLTVTHIATYIMALLYATTLFYYAFLIVHEHRCILKDLNDGKRLELAPFVKYTRWSLVLMVMLAFGFPLMTFNTSLLMRSLYGIMAISVFFFYIVSFAIYGIKIGVPQAVPMSADIESEGQKEKLQLSVTKMERMNSAIEAFIKSDAFTKSSITIKEAAEIMGVSMNMLKIWLSNSEYVKYNNWITALRIAKAKELLLSNPDMSYDAISEKCGFCDRQYFYRQFKKQEGVSPNNWIKDRIVTNEDELLQKTADKEPIDKI